MYKNFKDLERENENLWYQLKHAEHKIKTLTSNYEQLQRKYQELDDKREALIADNFKLEQELSRKMLTERKEIKENPSQIRKLTNRLKRLQEENDCIYRKVSDLNSQVNTLTSTNNELKNKLSHSVDIFDEHSAKRLIEWCESHDKTGKNVVEILESSVKDHSLTPDEIITVDNYCKNNNVTPKVIIMALENFNKDDCEKFQSLFVRATTICNGIQSKFWKNRDDTKEKFLSDLTDCKIILDNYAKRI